MVYGPLSRSREHNTFELAGNRVTFRRLPLPYIDAAILAQYQAGCKLNGVGDYGFDLSSRLPKWRFPLLNSAVTKGQSLTTLSHVQKLGKRLD